VSKANNTTTNGSQQDSSKFYKSFDKTRETATGADRGGDMSP